MNSKILVGLLVIIILTKCNFSTGNIYNLLQGEWKVESMNSYPLSLSEFKDLEIDTLTTIRFIDKGMKIIFSDTIRKPQFYKFFIEGNNLNIWYSDYTLTYVIEELSKTTLILKSAKGNRRITLQRI